MSHSTKSYNKGNWLYTKTGMYQYLNSVKKKKKNTKSYKISHYKCLK